MHTQTRKSLSVFAFIFVILSMCPGATHAQSCTPPPSGLVSWWRGESNAVDTVSGNNGVLIGNMTYAAGNVGQAFSSDGNHSAVSLGNPASLRLQNFTIEAWVKRGSLTQASVDNPNGGIFFGYGNQGYNLAMFNDGHIFLGQVGVSSVTSSLQLTDLNWHHVAVTTDSGNVVFYVDGVGSAAGFYNPTFQFTTSVAIGARGDDFTASFLGLMDEVSVYNRALTASEIQAIFSAGSAGKCNTAIRPSIVHQPLGQTSLVGGTVVFLVDAAGSTPLSYQWRLGGTNLSGATNYSMEITNVKPTNAGPYSVVVTNAYGSVTSAPAVLTLLLPPSIVMQPQSQTNYVGGNTAISVTASGSSNLFYQWQFGGTNIAGATNPTLQLNNLQFSNTGNYSVVVTNPYGFVPSSDALLTVAAPACASAPSSLVGWWQGEGSTRDSISGGPGTLIGNATYAAGKVGQAFNLDGNGDAVLVGNTTNLQLQNFTIEAWVKRSSLTQASLNNFNGGIIFGYGHSGYNLALLDDGTPLLGQVDSSEVFGTQKITDTAFHHLAVTKNGTVVIFYVDGVAGQATNYATTFQFITPAAIGSRGDNFGASFFGAVDEASVYSRALSASEIQAVYASTTLGKCATPLSILSQPTNQSLTVGSNVTFIVTVTGSGPISIQWFQNGAPISGATNATLTLTGATYFQAGTYSVTVSNALGAATNTSSFVFTVKPPLLLANGGFETGDFTDWLTNDLTFPLYPLTVRSNGFDPAFGFFLTTPTEGIFCATHGFEGGGPGTISVAQDVLLPSGPAILTFDYRAAWDMSNYSGSTLPRTFAVTLQPSGGGTPLRTFTLLTAAPGTANPDTGPLSGSLDISANSGRSLRVSFDATVPEFYTGPGFFQLDNVVLSYSVLPPLVIAQSGANVVLMWPASTTNYTLQSSSNLTLSNSWSAINTNLIVHGATNTSATLPITPNSTFYRLVYP